MQLQLQYMYNVFTGVASIASMMPTFAQTTPLINSNATTQIPKETVELDSETADKITLQCKNIIQEYKALRNIEVCNIIS